MSPCPIESADVLAQAKQISYDNKILEIANYNFLLQYNKEFKKNMKTHKVVQPAS